MTTEEIADAINGVTIDGQPVTAATLSKLLQYASLAMQRDEAQARAALQQQANGAAANAAAQKVAGYQAAATKAQNDVAALLGGQQG